jgi:hypothetical protein
MICLRTASFFPATVQYGNGQVHLFESLLNSLFTVNMDVSPELRHYCSEQTLSDPELIMEPIIENDDMYLWVICLPPQFPGDLVKYTEIV